MKWRSVVLGPCPCTECGVPLFYVAWSGWRERGRYWRSHICLARSLTKRDRDNLYHRKTYKAAA